MKRLYSLMFLFALLFPQSTLAQGGVYHGKLDLDLSESPRFIGSSRAGLYSQSRASLYVNNPLAHGWFFGLEYFEAKTDVPESKGLVLSKEKVGFGLGLKLRSGFGIRTAFSSEEFFGDTPYSAFGVYPFFAFEKGEVEIGQEKDRQGENSSEFTYLHGSITASLGTVYYGASRESIVKVYGPFTEGSENRRFGSGVLWSLDQRHNIFTGSNYNTRTQKPTWILGFSRNASRENNGANPAAFVLYRKKPETDYVMALFTLWGKSLSSHMTQGLFSTFDRGGLKSSRIVAGRNIDQPGVSGGHEQSDFGRISLAATMFSIDTGLNTELVMREVSCYLTYPENFGSFVRPYVGFAWREFSDLVYDMGTHQLTDPLQRLWEFKVGTKLKLWEEEDHRDKRELGYIRLSLTLDTNGGLYAKGSFWF